MNLSGHSRRLLNSYPQLAVDAQSYQVLYSTKAFKERILELIAAATQRIYIVALYLEDDDAGREILRALFEAKQQRPNLDVRVFVDFHRAQRGLIGQKECAGNRQMYQQMAAEYQHPIDICGVPVKSRELFGVLHLKGFVFDNTVLYSGASLNDVYLHQSSKYRFDRYHQIGSQPLADCMANFVLRHFSENPAVRSLNDTQIPTAKQLKKEIKEFRQQMRRAHYQFQAEAVTQGEFGITPLAGMGKRGNHLNKLIRHLIRSARQEIFICTPYFNLPRPLAKEICKKMRQGIKVTLVVGDKTANDFYIQPGEKFTTIGGLPYFYETYLRRFAQANEHFIQQGLLNIMLWKHDENSYHLKGMFVDQDLALITGNNLNPRAWGMDLENGILIQDPQKLLADEFAKEKEAILQHCSRIDSFDQLEQISDYPDEVQRLLKKIIKMQAHHIIKRIV
ncbi:CDP-diacylglycerol--serine O-phosphatidyltransferase [Dongshaea marina]|uniref:CDP-diacylglycerol--serine O-phosphatidyltransferase n=1 Tax=Dongshaea marina TaxID=2047966 RepID=UPI000D3ED2CD|nr:CDP-diacylglycerol--serine O-phosphatidyltransferase [Dongshaea marina]